MKILNGIILIVGLAVCLPAIASERDNKHRVAREVTFSSQSSLAASSASSSSSLSSAVAPTPPLTKQQKKDKRKKASKKRATEFEQQQRSTMSSLDAFMTTIMMAQGREQRGGLECYLCAGDKDQLLAKALQDNKPAEVTRLCAASHDKNFSNADRDVYLSEALEHNRNDALEVLLGVPRWKKYFDDRVEKYVVKACERNDRPQLGFLIEKIPQDQFFKIIDQALNKVVLTNNWKGTQCVLFILGKENVEKVLQRFMQPTTCKIALWLAFVMLEESRYCSIFKKHVPQIIFLCAQQGHKKELKDMKQGWDSVGDKQGFDPFSEALHVAIREQQAGAVSLLLSFGANPNFVVDGHTLFELVAVEQPHDVVVNAFIQAHCVTKEMRENVQQKIAAKLAALPGEHKVLNAIQAILAEHADFESDPFNLAGAVGSIQRLCESTSSQEDEEFAESLHNIFENGNWNSRCEEILNAITSDNTTEINAAHAMLNDEEIKKLLSDNEIIFNVLYGAAMTHTRTWPIADTLRIICPTYVGGIKDSQMFLQHMLMYGLHDTTKVSSDLLKKSLNPEGCLQYLYARGVRISPQALDDFIQNMLKRWAADSTRISEVAIVRMLKKLQKFGYKVAYDDHLINEAVYGHTKQVAFWLKCSADLVRNDEGRTALMRACALPHVGVVKLLLTCGDSPQQNPDKQGLTVFDHALASKNDEIINAIVDALVKKCGVAVFQTPDHQGSTLLARACAAKNQRCIDRILEIIRKHRGDTVGTKKNASTSSVSNDVESLRVAFETENYALVKQLVNQGGCNVEATDADGEFPLLWAARSGNKAIVGFILSKVRTVTQCTALGKTALSEAASHKEIQQLLRARGAHNTIDESFARALQHGSAQTINKYLDLGLSPTKVDDTGNAPYLCAFERLLSTPVSSSAVSPDVLALHTILNRIADSAYGCVCADGETALIKAVRAGNTRALDLLLKGRIRFGFDVNARRADGKTAYMLAHESARPCRSEMLTLLQACDAVDTTHAESITSSVPQVVASSSLAPTRDVENTVVSSTFNPKRNDKMIPSFNGFERLDSYVVKRAVLSSTTKQYHLKKMPVVATSASTPVTAMPQPALVSAVQASTPALVSTPVQTEPTTGGVTTLASASQPLLVSTPSVPLSLASIPPAPSLPSDLTELDYKKRAAALASMIASPSPTSSEEEENIFAVDVEKVRKQIRNGIRAQKWPDVIHLLSKLDDKDIPTICNGKSILRILICQPWDNENALIFEAFRQFLLRTSVEYKNVADECGMTPLMYAVVLGNTVAADELREHGAR